MNVKIKMLSGETLETPSPIEDALRYQHDLYEAICADPRPTDTLHLIFAEHQSVYTYHRAKADKKGVAQFFRKKYPDICFTPPYVPLLPLRRAGAITYHGPGQLVCYIVTDRLAFGAIPPFPFARFVGETIDNVLIELLRLYGIYGEQKPPYYPREASGVWVQTSDNVYKKIVSRGIVLKGNRVTQFGFALNVSTDLSFFDFIYPCGLDIEMTSMETLIHQAIPLYFVSKKLQDLFPPHFDRLAKEKSIR